MTFIKKSIVPLVFAILMIALTSCSSKVQHIDFSYKKITDAQLGETVESIEPRIGTITLSLIGNPISDLTPLQSLNKLSGLYLDFTQVSDLAPLESLSNLQSLGLNNTNINDLTPLKELAELIRVSIQNTSVSDLTPLKSLKKIEFLYLGFTQVEDLTPLQSLENLKWLNIEYTKVDDITPLKSLTNLRSLYLKGNNFTEDQIQELKEALPNCTIYL